MRTPLFSYNASNEYRDIFCLIPAKVQRCQHRELNLPAVKCWAAYTAKVQVKGIKVERWRAGGPQVLNEYPFLYTIKQTSTIR